MTALAEEFRPAFDWTLRKEDGAMEEFAAESLLVSLETIALHAQHQQRLWREEERRALAAAQRAAG